MMNMRAQVQGKSSRSLSFSPVPTGLLQRKCACGGAPGLTGECTDCAKKHLTMQRYAASQRDVSAVPPIVHDVLRSPGRPLDPQTRAFMEPRFGHDFSQVRVHTDTRAAESAGAVNAVAYTVGRDVVFGQGRYAPETSSGWGLLAHELTHVVQQQQRLGSAAPQYELEVGPGNDHCEREADAVAQAVLGGQPAAQSSSALQGPRLQRFPVGFLLPFIPFALGLGKLLFGEGSFTDRELQAYLEYLATKRKIEGGFFSDNKARAIVKRWEAGDSKYNISDGYKSRTAELSAVDLKRLLIKEMLDGPTTDGDEKAILKILEQSSDDDVLKLLDPVQGVSVQALDDNIQGDNHDRFAAMLERRFPALGAPQVTRKGDLSCDARQAFMLHFARQQAGKIIPIAIRRLSQYLGANLDKRRTEFRDVWDAVQCYFTGATDQDVRDILVIYQKVPAELEHAEYLCVAEGTRKVTLIFKGKDPKHQGAEIETDLLPDETAQRPRFRDRTTNQLFVDPRTLVSPNFFKLLGPVQQALSLIHEAVHGLDTSIVDVKYEPSCEKLNLNQAKTNSDSFAQLAVKLAGRAPGTVAFAGTAISVTLGNFRNRGPIGAENECEVCPELPGLGLDTDTALNIMELRGDIMGHRAGVEYDFSRNKERAIWKRVGGAWTLLHYAPPETKDDLFGSDEDVIPKNHHIYAIDGPGLNDPDNPVPDPSAEEAVYRGTFVESVRARVDGGPWSGVSNDFPWHSVTWLEKVDGKWRRKPGANEIAPGSISVGKALPYGPGDYPLPAKDKNTGLA